MDLQPDFFCHLILQKSSWYQPDFFTSLIERERVKSIQIARDESKPGGGTHKVKK